MTTSHSLISVIFFPSFSFTPLLLPPFVLKSPCLCNLSLPFLRITFPPFISSYSILTCDFFLLPSFFYSYSLILFLFFKYHSNFLSGIFYPRMPSLPFPFLLPLIISFIKLLSRLMFSAHHVVRNYGYWILLVLIARGHEQQLFVVLGRSRKF